MPSFQHVIEDPDPLGWWTAHRGVSPVVGDSHSQRTSFRRDIEDLMAIDRDERLREEDPFTEFFIRDIPNRIVFHRSRFEIDLNRAREGAVYLQPEQAWGLNIWKEPPPDDAVGVAAVHDDYYAMLDAYLRGIEEQYGRFVVLDIHSYNHRRDGADAPPAGHPKTRRKSISAPTPWTGSDGRMWSTLSWRRLRAFEFRGQQDGRARECRLPRQGRADAIHS